jgi:hypothetical protein
LSRARLYFVHGQSRGTRHSWETPVRLNVAQAVADDFPILLQALLGLLANVISELS